MEYEALYHEDNRELTSKVSEELGATGAGVPLIVIGEDYFRSSSSMNEKIKEAIVSQYKNDDYIDVVGK